MNFDAEWPRQLEASAIYGKNEMRWHLPAKLCPMLQMVRWHSPVFVNKIESLYVSVPTDANKKGNAKQHIPFSKTMYVFSSRLIKHLFLL